MIKISQEFSRYFHTLLQKLAADTKHYRDRLKQLKDFDQRAAREIVAAAFIERERRRLEAHVGIMTVEGVEWKYCNWKIIDWTTQETDIKVSSSISVLVNVSMTLKSERVTITL